ncbi:tail terminator [Bacillus phage vB_BceS-M2]|nr:hypothetical protein PBC5_022 [Bacillus phage PBC5]
MIQDYFVNECKAAYPELEWSVDYYEGAGNKGVVYLEQGDPPENYDVGWRYPYYMFFIRSEDFYRAEQIAYSIFERFNKRLKERFTTTDGQVYDIIFIEASSDVNRLGVREGCMEYTVNFKATLQKIQ